MPSSDPVDVALGAMTRDPGEIDLGLPAWMNARYALAVGNVNRVNALTTAGGEVFILPARPTRWLVSFHSVGAFAGTWQLRSEYIPASAFHASGTGAFMSQYALFSFGLIVPAKWFITASAIVPLVIIEHYI